MDVEYRDRTKKATDAVMIMSTAINTARLEDAPPHLPAGVVPLPILPPALYQTA
jgi:hypothetical protein